MQTIDQDMKNIIEGTILCFTATVNRDGSPNLSPKSTLKVFDERHLIFANIASPGTLTNLKSDDRIEINCVDIFSRRGYRFKGTGSIHSVGTKIYMDLLNDIQREHGKTIPVFDAILVEVHETKPILSPAYHFVKGVTEDSLRDAYMLKYNVSPVTARNSGEPN